MKIHNTLTRSLEDFVPQNRGVVSLYTCGPTVYDKLTVGNWTAYIRWDVLARTLRLSNDLNWYMNITDVGHLVSDGDEGEDKLEKGAKREGKSAWDVAKFYTEDFISGLDLLGISIDKSHLVKATDHIPQQIELIQKLDEKGYTYVIDDGVYFDSTKFKEYGLMARLDLSGQQAGARVDVGQKKHASDFALWKFSPKDSKRDMEWDSPWGKGFPGWHIECSAMSMNYLGETIDIHTGGIDHIPVHHTNEIAQSEAATGKQFVRYWLHSNFLQVNGTKIAKSLGNGFTLDDIQEKGFNGNEFRMFVLQSHYQTEANFTWEGLTAAKTRFNDLKSFADLRFQLLPQTEEQIEFDAYSNEIINAVEDNLNTPLALSTISRVISEAEKKGISTNQSSDYIKLLEQIEEILGFRLLDSTDITDEQKAKIVKRQEARSNKDFESSDEIRIELEKESIGLKDTPSGTIWYRI